MAGGKGPFAQPCETFAQFKISRLGGDAGDKQRDEDLEVAGHAEPQAG